MQSFSRNVYGTTQGWHADGYYWVHVDALVACSEMPQERNNLIFKGAKRMLRAT